MGGEQLLRLPRQPRPLEQPGHRVEERLCLFLAMLEPARPADPLPHPLLERRRHRGVFAVRGRERELGPERGEPVGRRQGGVLLDRPRRRLPPPGERRALRPGLRGEQRDDPGRAIEQQIEVGAAQRRVRQQLVERGEERRALLRGELRSGGSLPRLAERFELEREEAGLHVPLRGRRLLTQPGEERLPRGAIEPARLVLPPRVGSEQAELGRGERRGAAVSGGGEQLGERPVHLERPGERRRVLLVRQRALDPGDLVAIGVEDDHRRIAEGVELLSPDLRPLGVTVEIDRHRRGEPRLEIRAGEELRAQHVAGRTPDRPPVEEDRLALLLGERERLLHRALEPRDRTSLLRSGGHGFRRFRRGRRGGRGAGDEDHQSGGQQRPPAPDDDGRRVPGEIEHGADSTALPGDKAIPRKGRPCYPSDPPPGAAATASPLVLGLPGQHGSEVGFESGQPLREQPIATVGRGVRAPARESAANPATEPEEMIAALEAVAILEVEIERDLFELVDLIVREPPELSLIARPGPAVWSRTQVVEPESHRPVLRVTRPCTGTTGVT